LLAVDVAERELHDRAAVPRLLLRPGVRTLPVLEPGQRRRGGAGCPWNRRKTMRRHELPHVRPQLLAPLGGDALDLGRDGRAELLEAHLFHEVLHARLVAVLALPVTVLDADDRLAPDEEVLGGHEVADRLGEERLRSETAAGEDGEAARAVAEPGVEPDVVHRALR